MYIRSRIYLKRIIHAFLTCPHRLKELGRQAQVRVSFVVLIILLSAWFVSQFVLASKEVSVYVFPSVVTSDGFENETGAIGQDLSSDAALSDFDRMNSAYIYFGKSLIANATSSNTQVSATTSAPLPKKIIVPPMQLELPTSKDITPQIPVSMGEVISTLPVQSTNGGRATSSIGDMPPALDLPNPFLQGQGVPSLNASTSPAHPQSRNQAHEELAQELFGIHKVLAFDNVNTPSLRTVMSTTSVTTSTSSSSSTVLTVGAERTATDNVNTPSLRTVMSTTSIATSITSSSSSSTTTLGVENSETATKQSVTPMSDDPYSVASCTTQGIPCHLMSFVGFGLGDALLDKPLLSATLELSLAGRGEFVSKGNDRILVRAYHGGRWEYLGETPVKGEFSNAKRGGYLSFDLPSIGKWGDLSDLKIVVEYVREGEGDASAYVDGVWINAKYNSDVLANGTSPDNIALTSANVRSALSAKDALARKAYRDELKTVDRGVIMFSHVDEHPDAKLVIKTDRDTYHALGSAGSYFNVTNNGSAAEVVRLQFHFPGEGGQVTALSRYAHNVPYKVGALKYDAVGYFCAEGWSSATSSAKNQSASSSASQFQCSATRELRACDSLNTDKTNCIENSTKVGLSEDTEYRDGWTPVALRDGSFRDEGGLFAKAIEFILGQLPKDAIPPSEQPVSYIADSVLLQPGQTMYFHADLGMPLNGRGDFYVEAAAESGAYGLVHASWDGSWNYRVPLSIDNAKVASEHEFAVPVSLDALPLSFWTHSGVNGNDLRFVSGDGDNAKELPYWLASWHEDTHTGLAWVRVPKMSTGTTTNIYLYYGDKDAESLSDAAAPFRTDELTPRATVFGGSQHDMVLHAIALTDRVRITAGAHDTVTLMKGESALFDALVPDTQVLADGPVALTLQAGGGNATLVPMGYAGTNFIAPGIGGERTIALSAQNDDTHAELRTNGKTISIDPVMGSIVSSPVELTASTRVDATDDILALLSSDDVSAPTPLYPSTNETLYGFLSGKTSVGFGTDGSTMTAVCSTGAREDVDGRREGATTLLKHCAPGVPELGDAVAISHLNNAVSVLSDDQGNLNGFLPKSEFASAYTLSEDARAVSLLCAPEENAFDIGVFDPQGTLIASTTCEGRGARPGKTFLVSGGAYVSGSVLRSLDASSTTFMAAYEGVGRSVIGEITHPLITIHGIPLMRSSSPNNPDIHLGEEEFVIPGEHRKLDIDKAGKEKNHVDKLLSKNREFSMRQLPGFTFQYTPQSNSLIRSVRSAFGVQPFSVTKVELDHPTFGTIDPEYDISYGDNDQWSVSLKNSKQNLRPGKYTLHIEIEEGGTTYVDEYDFYWGVLAINYNKSVFTPGETADISMGALSNNGNTICDANLKLWITTPLGVEGEVPVTPSGLCNGNNVVDVPDYSATFKFPATMATGTYKVKLVRFDQNDNVASQVTDTIEVRESVPFEIERVGPTRIYPIAHYPMKIRVRANEDFKGYIVEHLPGDFVLIDRGNADLQWGDDAHTFITATWPVDMKKGAVIDLSYIFDAPDRSPYLYELGPIEMKDGNEIRFSELRKWQIASDAAGQMLIFFDRSYDPIGWSCVSCLNTDPFYQRFVVGSSTYGVTGGSATHTPSASATVYATTFTGVGPVTTNNTTNAPLSHSHSLTPQLSAQSNLPTYRQLRVLLSASAGDSINIPAGAIMAFDIASSSLPSGWLRYGAQDGAYIFGEGAIGATGGANTHSHTATGTLTNAVGSGLRSQNGVVGGATGVTHNHTLTATSTNVANNEPPYMEVVLGQLGATTTATTSNYMIAMWNNTPPTGWITVSNAGGALDQKFLKASTTYGTSGGASTHTHFDIIGATTSIAGTLTNYTANASNGQAPSTHTHNVDITGFSTDSNLPPYIGVIFAKRLVGVIVDEQKDYRFYANANANTVTDPWPTGAIDILQNTPIDSSTQLAKPTDILRLRMNIAVTNSTSTVGGESFKMQYVASTNCVNALNWSDVAAIGSSTALWRGYDNTSVTNGALLATTTLSTSNVVEGYVEQNNSTATPTQIPIGQAGEWDWVLQDNLAIAGTNYCFRMVKSDGTPLDTYTNYPQALTNTQPSTPSQSVPFNNEKASSTLPNFNFVGTDPETNDLDYEIQIDTSNIFSSPVIDKDSTVNPELFDNLSTPTNKAPFRSGDTIHYQATALTNGTTYWWRVRAKDSTGSNTWGSWSTPYSFTVDTTVVISTWHQTTSSQFQTGTLIGTDSSTSDSVMLTTGSSTGTIYSPSIDFSLHTTGTVWGNLKFATVTPPGTLNVQLEYLTSTSSWALVPDAALPGNSSGLTASSTSLTSVDPSIYSTIRPRANLTNSGGTPKLLDWTIEWGYAVATPSLTSPFDNTQIATQTPAFIFTTTDPEGDALNYEISWSTTSSFTSSTTANSATTSAGFVDLTTPAATNPYPSGDSIQYTIQPSYILASSTTYYWRVRARDPGGANAYSFWSSVRSLTIDTTTVVATWFQTMDDQWNTNLLTGLETYGTNTLRVATNTTEALVGYGEGTQQTPKYRIWGGTAWGAQSSALTVNASINWVVTKNSPVNGEYLMGTLGTNNNVYFQVYSGGVWGNKQSLTNGVSNARARGFDAAYETLTGRAVAVSCNGGVNPVYRIWSSTSSAWSSSNTINVTGANNCEWIRLASNPISNEIVMLERDTGSRYFAGVWNGSTWVTGATTTLGSITATANEGMAVEYNASGTQAFVTTSNGTNNNFLWTFWNGTTWATPATVATSRRILWLDLGHDPNNNNNLIACYGDLTNPDVGVSRFTGAAWSTNVNLTTAGNSPYGKDEACLFETTAGRSGDIMVPYSTTGGAQYSFWNGAAWSVQAAISSIGRSWTVQARRTLDGKVLGMFFEYLAQKYQFSYWDGTTWSASTTLEASPSVTTSPYLEPFMMVAKNSATQGTIFSTAINFVDGNAPAWDKVLWSSTITGSSTFMMQVQYLNATSSAWELIPDADIAGNSSGTSTSPINIRNLNTAIYSQIRLVGNATCVLGNCPYLNDWTVQWASGLNISGTAKAHDLVTPVTSGTVAVAVNGVLQAGKTGTITAGGTWTIPNVTFFPNSTIEVFVTGAATSARAVSTLIYNGPGDLTGMSLNEHWLTIGSTATTSVAVSLTNLSKYDNSVAGSNDIFFDVDNTTGNFNNCALALVGGCYDAGILVLGGNTFSPSTTTAKTILTYDMNIKGQVYTGANTLKVGGNWTNTGGYTGGSGTVIFNATTSTQAINSSGAASSTFSNVTFGEAATAATWSLSSAFMATGTVAMNFGTVSPGAQTMTLQGDLTIGASGIFQKGSATTTFSGSIGRMWTDGTASKQDLGNVQISGTSKTITLGSSVKASNINIVAGNTLDAGGANTFTVLGFWDNAGAFTSQTGTVLFAATTVGNTINQGSSAFYNLNFNGVGGAWLWLNTNATTSNDLTIATGTVTLPGGTLSVGSSFNNSGGTFVHNSGVVRMTATVGGKNVRANGSSFFDLVFAGSGGAWSFLDTNATTSNSLTISAGTPTFPSGVLEVGNNFINSGGSFTANGGTLKMTSTLTSRTITLGGSSLGGLTIQNAGIFTITDASAIATGDVTFNAGTTTLPTSTFTIGGSLVNSGVFVAGGDTVTFNASAGAKTINTGNSSFAYAIINGVGGNFTVSAYATTTNDFTLTNANAFTMTSGKTLAVGGTFTNLVGGASTTWTGSTLALNSGTSYSINTKTQGGDLYDTLRISPNMQIRSWNSSSVTYAIDPTSSLYSQNHAGVSGEVDIFGAYTRALGSDYWDYATDFDGTALSGGARRTVSVKFASGATAAFGNGTTLEIVGGATATTSIDRQSSGNYGITLTTATLNASYYQFRNMNTAGLNLQGSTTITSLSFGDFSLDVNGGTSITVASTTINTNPAIQIFNVKFATSSGISSGFNVTESGTATSYWRFKLHYGNYAGEAFDNDPGPNSGNPGYVRWDDSNFVISISGVVYSDAGVTPIGGPTCDGSTLNVRVKVAGLGNFATSCSATSSYYSIAGVTFSGDTVMTVYLDTNGGAQAAIVTRSASADLTGFNLYQHRVIVREEDVTPLSIADMHAYDKTGDTDIPFTASTSSVPYTLTVDPNTEFWIWNGKTFVPNGNVTLNSGGGGATYDGTFHIDNNATFTAQGTETHSVGGRFAADSGAIFTAASSTFNFTATTSGKLIVGIAPLTFWRMNFNGVGGNWSVNQNITVGENFTVNAGTVSGASNVTVNGTSITGAGAVAMTGGTFTLANGGTFGGNTDWAFNNLTFGNGTIATTTKTGSSTVTIAGVLTDSAGQVFLAGTSTTWLLTGGGTPLVFSGAFTVQNAVVRYAGSGATNVTPATYAQLDFGALGTSSPVYTLNAGTFTIGSTLNIGTTTGSLVTVNINTNNPTITASGDVNILASSTLILGATGTFTTRRNWSNQGTTTSSGGTVTFDATTTGFIINPGNSAFANVVFNNTSGGWTIVGNATTTSNLTLTAANSFTMASGTTLEVDGLFTNSVGGSPTTWTGSILYLNSGGGQTINSKIAGADVYDTLKVGASTAVRMWNSYANTYSINPTGSLYSQNHANVSGALNIYGAYTHSSGTDYWSYATDFDGATSTARQVNVRFASNTTATFSGGGLEVLGIATASTTLDVQSVGAYAWNITGGSTTMRYYTVRNADANGMNISGTPIINDLSDGDFQLAVDGGTMMKVAGGTIDANPLKIFKRNRFATSSGVATGTNVTATGVSVSAWRFNLHYGNRAGEAYDLDPGGDPGYIIWDDSAAQLVISGNVYSDEGVTPIGGLVCDGVTQNVRLKVQGVGAYTSACNAGTGAYSISGVVYNPGDTLTLYLASGSNAKAVNVAYDPATNINNMNLYQNRVIVRHEQGSPVGIAQMAQYDSTKDSNIPFTATTSPSATLSVASSTGLIVWNSKVFAPGGNVTIHANASANSWDGTVHLYATSTWSSAGTQTHTIGGQFLADSGASVAPANSTFIFSATTSGKAITAANPLTFYNLTFNGVGGVWNISGVATTSNDLTIATGTVTLPSGTFAVGGSFTNSGGTFAHNSGTIQFTSSAIGKSIQTNSSSLNNLLFSGSGAWSFVDTNATTTGSVTMTAGTLTLPSGIIEVGNNFDNQSGVVSVLSGSILKMTSTSTNRIIRAGGSWLAGLTIANAGTFTFADTNATTSGTITLLAGTTTFPAGILAVGGSFANTAVFQSGTGTVSFIATSSNKTINPGNSSFYNAGINGSGGTFTINANATTTNNFTLQNAAAFTLSSGATLAVGGTFTNLVGGAPTTWTGSTLALNSGTSYTLDTKTQGADQYETLRLAPNTNIRMWGSAATAISIDPTASLYSQNNAGVSGSLYIYGNYSRSSGSDYWSYATDFDGTALGGSPRQANVRFGANATATFSGGATLAMIGGATASTTVDNQGAGNYGITITSSIWNASYYQFRNMNAAGLSLLGTTTITTMNNGDFSLDVNAGTSITIASTTVNQNASAQIFTVKFATSSGVNTGYNVSLLGSTANAITFNLEYGPFAGEAHNLDGATTCGSIRWTDSSCLISDQRGFRFRNDDGAEGAPATEWYNQSWTKRERVRITNTATSTLTNTQVKMVVPYDTDMRSHFEDLRFTDSSGTTSIPFWVEASTTVTTATVWVKVPSLPASSFADVFMYFGNATGTIASDGLSTFKFFDDFNSGNITLYSGDTTLFANNTAFNYEGSYGLSASAGNTTAQTTSGIGQASVGVGRDTTFRFFQYIDMSTGSGDEPCFIFGMQSPITVHQNYGVCLSPFGADHVVIAKNVAYNGRSDGSTQLSSKGVTFTTGWYETSVDWIATNNQINVNVYDSNGSFFASTSASDSTYTSGGVGFSFWGMHGGWDIPQARVYNYIIPTVAFGTKQADSGATWKVAENTYAANVAQSQNIRLRFSVRNSSLATLNDNFRLQYAPKLASPNCESVVTGNYIDVPTTTSSCGSESACMTSSTQFTNKASTTQLLSIPTGYTFAQGEIVKDPSNQTDVMSVAANQYTEVEYNFQMTANASQDRYCFRTTNAGVALDNYTHVAELQVLHPPFISGLSFNQNQNISLTEGTTTLIMATATVTDLNGYTDIVAASSTYYRSSISGANACTADNNNCYQIATTSCSFSNCSGNSCTVSCQTKMYYFADPTDVVSIFAADNWQAFMDVWDTSNSHNTSSANQELYTLSGLTTTSTIAYGTLAIGGDTGPSDATTSVNNTGNAALNLNLGGDHLRSGASIVSYDKQKYATSTFTYSSCPICSVLTASTTPTYVPLNVLKATSTAWSPFKDIYWGISIPTGTAATTFSGYNIFGATL